jgi:MYXO-CTERM domain-containing protein
MLFSGSTLPGPKLGRVDFSITENPAGIVVDSFAQFDQDVYGRLALAPAGANTLRAVTGRHRVELGTDPGASPTPAVPALTPLETWPVGLGAADGSHRLGHVVEVECGDGLVHDPEECDDGNLVTGDGCDDMCMFEDDPWGSESGSETGGDPPFVDGEGCQCASAASRDDTRTSTTLALGLLVFGRARRRRRAQNSHQS